MVRYALFFLVLLGASAQAVIIPDGRAPVGPYDQLLGNGSNLLLT